MNMPAIVSPQAWETARQEMLVKEKALVRARDALAAERRRMPWMAVEKAYAFESPRGKVSLLDLFEGRKQLRSDDDQRAWHVPLRHCRSQCAAV